MWILPAYIIQSKMAAMFIFSKYKNKCYNFVHCCEVFYNVIIDIVSEWTALNVVSATTAAENRTEWNKIFAKSYFGRLLHFAEL